MSLDIEKLTWKKGLLFKLLNQLKLDGKCTIGFKIF